MSKVDRLRSLSLLSEAQGDYAKAAELLEQRVERQAAVVGVYHVSLATDFHDLGLLYHAQDKFEMAEVALLKALWIEINQAEPEALLVSETANALGKLYCELDAYAQVEPRYRQLLADRGNG